MLLRRSYVTSAVAGVLILLGLLSGGQALRSRTTIEGASDPSSKGASLCLSRSINYITQTLPQQCLRTDWTRETEAPTLGSTQSEVHAQRPPFTGSGTHHDATTTYSSHQSPTNLVKGTITKALSEVLPTIHDQAILPSSSSASTQSHPQSVSGDTAANEEESPLDKVNFLSFEEWKNLNLAKAGQSADHVGSGRTGIGETEPRYKPGSIHNDLVSLGEDDEIEIDFGGFSSPGVPSQAVSSQDNPTNDGTRSPSGQKGETRKIEDIPAPHPRGKDAGKTCKERSNYASFDCAATVLKTNPECKGGTSVLVENKDSYMLNECSAKNKFFIVELCDHILIDTIVLANFEFFSSMFRTFRVSVSDRYPVKLDKWRELGIFEARNTREVQAFLVENSLIWARYIRVEFLTHFGNEYYCPVSLFRVHGTTMMEEFNHDMKSSMGEDDAENESVVEEGSERISGVVTADALKDTSQSTLEQIPTMTNLPITSTSAQVGISSNVSHSTSGDIASNCENSEKDFTPFESSSQVDIESLFLSQKLYNSMCAVVQQTPLTSPTIASPSPAHNFAETTKVVQAVLSPSVPDYVTTSKNRASIEVGKSTESSVGVALSSSSELGNHTKPPSSSQFATPVPQDSAKHHTSATQPSSPNPTTQESFFKSVHKRLQLLESNSTLSLQYIEDQSRILRDAFSAVEKRQMAKSTTFLETLNSTVLNELREFRTQYDQIWQSTVLELSAQRESSQYEVLALSARISLLADEIVYQKRIAILQFALILLCLCLVIFSRNGASANHLEFPSLAFNRSTSNLSGFGPHFETPPSTRPPSRYGLFGRGNAHERNASSPPQVVRSSSRYSIFRRGTAHERCPSEESALNGSAKGPDIEYSPPTPTSQSTEAGSNGEGEAEVNETSSQGSDLDRTARKIHSNPATLGRNGIGRPDLDEGGSLTPEPEHETTHERSV